MSNYTHQTAPTQFVQANGIRFAYRRLDVTNLDRLPMASPVPVEGLDQVKLQSKELAGVWTVGANVLLGHAVLALPQKAKSCEPRCDYFHCH